MISSLYTFIQSRRIRYLGSGSKIHFTAIIKSPHKLEMGLRCSVREYVIIDAKSKEQIGIKLGNDVVLKPKVYLSSNGGHIMIGSYVGIGHGCWIGGQSKITIGENTLIGTNSVIINSNHDYMHISVPFYSQPEIEKPVYIGKNVWIGASCVVLPGVQIGNNAVIGAGSVVVDEIPENAIAFGVPAKIVRYKR